jgi:hypothetical protein
MSNNLYLTFLILAAMGSCLYLLGIWANKTGNENCGQTYVGSERLKSAQGPVPQFTAATARQFRQDQRALASSLRSHLNHVALCCERVVSARNKVNTAQTKFTRLLHQYQSAKAGGADVAALLAEMQKAQSELSFAQAQETAAKEASTTAREGLESARRALIDFSQMIYCLAPQQS